MKLFKNPVFAVLLCLVIVVTSTALNVKIKLPKRYAEVCEELCDAIIDFSSKQDLTELETQARNLRQSTVPSRHDCGSLIYEYNQHAAAASIYDTKTADKAVRNYTSVCSTINRFPANYFMDLFHITF